MKEIYKPIPGFPDYFASSDGKIKSLKFGKSRILLTHIAGAGYLQVVLFLNGKRHQRKVHKLVFNAFYGVSTAGLECNHKDGDKTNNHISNIEYVTRSENMLHAYRTGLKKAKLTLLDVKEIRRQNNLGAAQKHIAAEYGVSISNISMIINNKRWKGIIA